MLDASEGEIRCRGKGGGRRERVRERRREKKRDGERIEQGRHAGTCFSSVIAQKPVGFPLGHDSFGSFSFVSPLRTMCELLKKKKLRKKNSLWIFISVELRKILFCLHHTEFYRWFYIIFLMVYSSYFGKCLLSCSLFLCLSQLVLVNEIMCLGV